VGDDVHGGDIGSENDNTAGDTDGSVGGGDPPTLPSVSPAVLSFSLPISPPWTSSPTFPSCARMRDLLTAARGIDVSMDDLEIRVKKKLRSTRSVVMSEVVKALRKSPIPAANAPIGVPSGVVVLAADISPMRERQHRWGHRWERWRRG
jgi:hypothetical protein